jgi:hypothetical protein
MMDAMTLKKVETAIQAWTLTLLLFHRKWITA